VKERVVAFERRTGERYAPPLWLQALGRPLASRDACPTLFRFPGPEGLLAQLQGRLHALGPAGRGHLWLTSRPTGAYPRPVSLFGTLALLQPLRLQPCRTHCFTHKRDNWIALERAVPPEELAWVPPSHVRGGVSFDRTRTEDEARRRFGRGYEDERRRVLDRLSAYLEELGELKRAGAAGPSRHWCTVPARERRALLAAHGVAPRWTRP
jgi:hypothetical protein